MKLPIPPPPLTVRMIYPYYDNPKMLERQVENWNLYGGELRAAIRLIVVDDGSADLYRNFGGRRRGLRAG